MLRHDLADKGSSRNSYGSSRKPSASVAIGGAERGTGGIAIQSALTRRAAGGDGHARVM